MGWFSDFISNPIERVTKDVSDPGAAVQGLVSGVDKLGTQIDQGVRDIVPGGWKLPAMLAAMYATQGASGGEGGLSSLFNSPTSAMMPEGAVATPVAEGNVLSQELGPLTGTPPPTTPPPFSPDTISQGTNITEGLTSRSLPLSSAPGTQEALNTAVQGSMGSNPPIDYSGIQDTMPGFNSGPSMPGVSTPFSLSDMISNPMSYMQKGMDWATKNPMPALYGASSLYDMYAKGQMAKKQQDMYNQNRSDIMNTYAPGSPEYNLLQQQMARKDAAAGRNSQYGTRANDLAGTIAKLRMGALGGLQGSQNTLGNQALSNQFGMFNTPLMLAMYANR
jgi:hypothetical protein